MSKITIVEGNSNDKDNVRVLMVKGEKGKTGDVSRKELQEEITTRANADNVLQSQINGLASGSPLVATDTSEMTDTTKTYVNTTDGYWYYYNGTQWVQGDLYQSTQISENNPIILDAKNKITLDHYNIISETTKIQGLLSGYNTTTYTPTISTNPAYSAYNTYEIDIENSDMKILTCKAPQTTNLGVVIYYTDFTSASNTVVAISKFQSSFSTTYVSYVSTNDFYTIDVAKLRTNGFKKLYICYNDNDNAYLYANNLKPLWLYDYSEEKIIIDNKITLDTYNLISEITKIQGLLSGYDVTYFTPVISTNPAYISYNTYEIDIENSDIRNLTGKKPLATNLGITIYYTDFTSASRTVFDTEDFENSFSGTYVSYVSPNDYFTIDIAKLKINGYKKLYICYHDDDNAYIYGDNLKPSWLHNYSSDDLTFACVNMFNSIGAIGDSYTAGSAKHSDGTWSREIEHSYIATMGKRAGINWNNYGLPGATTRSYLSSNEGLVRVLSADANDFYFIAFGINDVNSLGIDYLGSVSDIKNDYHDNPDTFYGNYARIIEQVQNHNESAKLCLILPPYESGIYPQFSNAIKEIANHYSIPYIDPFDDDFFNSNTFRNMDDGHPTLAGYSGMGTALERLFSKCVEKNSNYFRYSTVG